MWRECLSFWIVEVPRAVELGDASDGVGYVELCCVHVAFKKVATVISFNDGVLAVNCVLYDMLELCKHK